MESRRLTGWLRPLGRLEKLTWALNLILMAGMLTLGYTLGGFSATSEHPTLMSTGTIEISLAGLPEQQVDAGIIDFQNTQPGLQQENTITVQNKGTLPFAYSVKAEFTGDEILFEAIQVLIKNGENTVYEGALNGLSAAKEVAQVEPESDSRVTFKVWLPDDVDNRLMGKKGQAIFYFDAEQVNRVATSE